VFKLCARCLMIIACTVLLGVPFPVAGRQTNADEQIKRLLDPIREKYKLPAMAGAIVTSKGLEAIGAVGVRKAGMDVAVTREDEWHLGSDTKAMTAVIMATLVERGRLNWDTTIDQIFPGLAENFPPQFRRITILELLSHHAGLPSNINWQEAARAGSLREQRLAALKTAASTKLLSEPGTKFEYSNLGYVIAGTIAERVTNKPWEELITDIVFKPLGMKSTGFGGTGTPGKLDQPWPHNADGKPTPSNGPTVDNPEVMGPAGTVHCSLSDWGKFIQDQLRGERGGGALLRPDTYKKLHTVPFDGDYAFGWLVTQREWGGGTVFTHAGSNTMNFAVVWVAPLRDFAVLVCSNQGGPTAAKACDEAAFALIGVHAKH
jgi:CubicO group peptidase (beta-lactamase class C family)